MLSVSGEFLPVQMVTVPLYMMFSGENHYAVYIEKEELFCYLVWAGGGRFIDKRHTGVLKCCNLGKKAVKTEGPAFLLITDSGGPRVEYAARC